MKRGAFFAATLALIALASGGARPQTPAPGAAPITPPPVGTAAAAPQLIPPPAPSCEAPSLTYLIGKSRTEIPVPVNPDGRRVYCTDCPVTEDYRPDRTDIVFDAKTGLIVKVTCG